MIPVLHLSTLAAAAISAVAPGMGQIFIQDRVRTGALVFLLSLFFWMVPLLILITSKLFGGAGFLFGWAKPVPVNLLMMATIIAGVVSALTLRRESPRESLRATSVSRDRA